MVGVLKFSKTANALTGADPEGGQRGQLPPPPGLPGAPRGWRRPGAEGAGVPGILAAYDGRLAQ